MSKSKFETIQRQYLGTINEEVDLQSCAANVASLETTLKDAIDNTQSSLKQMMNLYQDTGDGSIDAVWETCTQMYNLAMTTFNSNSEALKNFEKPYYKE